MAAPVDHRGTNFRQIGVAHAMAAEADERPTRKVLVCEHCGNSPSQNPDIKLLLCSQCKTVAYCSKTCQTENWKSHKAQCKQLVAAAKERRQLMKDELKQSDADGIMKRFKAQFPKDSNTDDDMMKLQVREIVRILQENVQNDMIWIEMIESKLGRMDGKRLHVIHADPDLVEQFYSAWGRMLERDIQKLTDWNIHREDVTLVCWNLTTHLLRTYPGEDDYLEAKSAKGFGSCSAERSSAYFRHCWERHLQFCAATWDATTAGNARAFVTCKELWRQLSMILAHEQAAKAIFEVYQAKRSTDSRLTPKKFFQPLIRMMDLNDQADDLEGLTNQMAGLLVIHSRKLPLRSLMDPKKLERGLTDWMDAHQKLQWKNMTLRIAQVIVEKGRVLEQDEFQRLMRQIHQRF